MKKFLSKMFGGQKTSPARNENTFRPQVEAFEDRMVLSTLNISGNLVFTAGAGSNVNNNLFVSRAASGNYTFSDTEEVINLTGNINGATGNGTNTVSIPAASVAANGTIILNLLGGNDTVLLNSARHQVIANMGAGNDRFFVGVGAITAAVRVNGEAGRDSLDYSIWETPVIATVNGRGTRVASMSGMENLTGGEAGDTLTGNIGGNILRGLGGSDTLSGLGGNDILVGGDGADRISGGVGSDVLIGGTFLGDSNLADPLASLQAIENVWQSGLTYNQRVTAIRAGVVAGGQARLNATTVTNDAFVDRLTGGPDANIAADRDWFWGLTTGQFADRFIDRVTAGNPELVN